MQIYIHRCTHKQSHTHTKTQTQIHTYTSSLSLSLSNKHTHAQWKYTTDEMYVGGAYYYSNPGLSVSPVQTTANKNSSFWLGLRQKISMWTALHTSGSFNWLPQFLNKATVITYLWLVTNPVLKWPQNVHSPSPSTTSDYDLSHQLRIG